MPSCALDRWVEVTFSALMVGPSIVSPRSCRASRSARSRLTSVNSLATKKPVPTVSSRPMISRTISPLIAGPARRRVIHDPASLLAARGLLRLLELAHLAERCRVHDVGDRAVGALFAVGLGRLAPARRIQPVLLAEQGQEDARLLRAELRAAPRAASGLGAVRGPLASRSRERRRPTPRPRRRICPGCVPPSSRESDAPRVAVCTPRRTPPDRARRSAPRRGARGAPAASPVPRMRSPSAPADPAASRSAARADRSTAARRHRHRR